MVKNLKGNGSVDEFEPVSEDSSWGPSVWLVIVQLTTQSLTWRPHDLQHQPLARLPHTTFFTMKKVRSAMSKAVRSSRPIDGLLPGPSRNLVRVHRGAAVLEQKKAKCSVRWSLWQVTQFQALIWRITEHLPFIQHCPRMLRSLSNAYGSPQSRWTSVPPTTPFRDGRMSPKRTTRRRSWLAANSSQMY